MTDVQILVIAEHAMIGALLGALVELAGHRPRFAEAGEAPDAAIERLRPDLVLLDCEHVAAGDEAAYRVAFEAGSRIALFGSSLSEAETERFAARRGVPCITLPIGYTAFSKRIGEVLAAKSARPPQREMRDQASA
jgi:DNA-binding response OmpR family regulator